MTQAAISPKVLILSMFSREANVWFDIPEFDLRARKLPIPGLSPHAPALYSTSDGSICQLTIGEGMVNAAITLTAVAFSRLIDLRKTYVLVAGVAGVNPHFASLGSVTFARFAVHGGLQYEIDAREVPSGWETGLFAQGTSEPGRFPTTLYGTEVFEVNDALRHLALKAASSIQLTDTKDCEELRTKYPFPAAQSPPSVLLGDTVSSDTFWSGTLLARAMEKTMQTITHGQGEYCTSQQEDNAILGALHRAALSGRADFARIIIMRSGSNFDRQFEGQNALDTLRGPTPGFLPALKNLYVAGVKVVEMISEGWVDTFERGVEPGNLIGDVYRETKRSRSEEENKS
ncbi:Purine nucleoside [Mycena indigotica]|uniref:Purine nucleoside n=1 Tax=Mycena indigotica TaxID=2126181 RepID=A0A8H6VRG8_9AGAR|nr:Purine nucleoside [Mycena indigotica]KAF7291332.1 Purine nucleoside [Mycena indigotica]